MKENLILTPDSLEVFERSLEMLDTSILQLRRVANNMIPDILVNLGLDEAVKEYCNSIADSKELSVKYQSFGMDRRINGGSEIIIYRIIQKLVDNSIKHADATEVLVQLVRGNDRLSVLVEDDGKGFDTSILEIAKVGEWINIRSGIDYLKGQLDIYSGIGKGTTITIEFKV